MSIEEVLRRAQNNAENPMQQSVRASVKVVDEDDPYAGGVLGMGPLQM